MRKQNPLASSYERLEASCTERLQWRRESPLRVLRAIRGSFALGAIPTEPRGFARRQATPSVLTISTYKPNRPLEGRAP